jgi:hypothetical protein
MMKFKTRKGIAPIVIVLSIAGVILLFYLVLYLPIPSFKALRYTINYWSILLLFITFQVGLVYVYYKIIYYLMKGFADIKYFVQNISNKFSNFIKIRLRV